jgi:hypothetical protein
MASDEAHRVRQREIAGSGVLHARRIAHLVAACLASACASDASPEGSSQERDSGQLSDAAVLSPSDGGADADAMDADLDSDAAESNDAHIDDGSSGPDADAEGATDAEANRDAATDAAVACTSAPYCELSAVAECSDAGLAKRSCDKGCSEGACNSACDADAVVIDQSQADDHATRPGWQTFQVEKIGVLTALELRPNVYSAAGDPSTLTVSIYVGDGIGGSRIAQQQYTLPSAGGAPFHTFTFSSSVPLQAGQVYTWEIVGGGTPYYAKADVYAGGHASTPGYDMVFRAHFAACH